MQLFHFQSPFWAPPPHPTTPLPSVFTSLDSFSPQTHSELIYSTSLQTCQMDHTPECLLVFS